MSIKTRILGLLLISLFIIGVIVSGVGMFVLYRQTVNSTEVTINNQTSQLVAQVNDLFDSFEKSGKKYIEDSEFKSSNAARIQTRIDTYFPVSWGIDRLNYLDATGKRIAIAPYDAKVIGDNLSDRKFFKDTLKDQTSHVSDVIINRVTGAPSVIVTQPVKSEGGQVAGMLLQAVDLETIQKFLAQVKVGTTGVTAVVAPDGTIIVHSNKNLIKEQKKIPAELMGRLISDTGRLTAYTDLAGRESVALAIPIKTTGWYAIASLPMREFRNGFYTSLAWMVVSLLVGLFVIGFIVWRFLLKTLSPVDMLVLEAAKIAKGDLTLSKLGIESNDEVGQLAKSFEQMTQSLRSLMLHVSEATAQVAASSEELNANAEQSAQAANQVAASIAVTAEGVDKQSDGVSQVFLLAEDIDTGSKDGVIAANQAAEITEQAVRATVDGSNAVTNAINQMNLIQRTVDNSANVVAELGERSKEIGVIVQAISSISGQTNLLALNAAIEAARAGEHGRGFAVVAEEVRKLAEQSQDAAKQITGLIGDIQTKTSRAVEAMAMGTSEVRIGADVVEKAGQAFKDIERHVQAVSQINTAIATGLNKAKNVSGQVYSATQEVDTISKDIANQAQNMSAATEELSASIQEIASSSQGLANLAEQLQQAVKQFEI